jgi:hypothetical protein
MKQDHTRQQLEHTTNQVKLNGSDTSQTKLYPANPISKERKDK